MKLTEDQRAKLEALVEGCANAHHSVAQNRFAFLVKFVESLTPGTEWGVMADPKIGVHVMTGEDFARATIDVTPEGQKPKLLKRPVGAWEEVPHD